MVKPASVIVAVASATATATATDYKGFAISAPKQKVTYDSLRKLFKADGATDDTQIAKADLKTQFQGTSSEVGLSANAGQAGGDDDQLPILCVDLPKTSKTTDKNAFATAGQWSHIGADDLAKLTKVTLNKTVNLKGGNSNALKFVSDDKLKTEVPNICTKGAPMVIKCTGDKNKKTGDTDALYPVLSSADGWEKAVGSVGSSDTTCQKVEDFIRDASNSVGVSDIKETGLAPTTFGGDPATISSWDKLFFDGAYKQADSKYDAAYTAVDKVVQDLLDGKTESGKDTNTGGTNETAPCCQEKNSDGKDVWTTGCLVGTIVGSVAGLAAIVAGVYYFFFAGSSASEGEAAPTTDESAPSDQTTEAEDSAPAEASSGSGKTVIIVIVVLVLVAGLAFFFCSGSSDAEAGEEEEGDATEEEG